MPPQPSTALGAPLSLQVPHAAPEAELVQQRRGGPRHVRPGLRRAATQRGTLSGNRGVLTPLSLQHAQSKMCKTSWRLHASMARFKFGRARWLCLRVNTTSGRASLSLLHAARGRAVRNMQIWTTNWACGAAGRARSMARRRGGRRCAPGPPAGRPRSPRAWRAGRRARAGAAAP